MGGVIYTARRSMGAAPTAASYSRYERGSTQGRCHSASRIGSRPTQIFGRRNRIMNNSKGFALRISMMCFGIALGALIIMSLVGAPHTVSAQNATAESLVYNFVPATGYEPTGLIHDATGNLYVATDYGGST